MMGIQSVEISGFLSDKISIEVKRVLSLKKPYGEARLIRLPVEDFNKAIQKAMKLTGGFMPFRPLFLGLPVDMTTGAMPEVIIVYDDNTNAAKTIKTEESVWPQ